VRFGVSNPDSSRRFPWVAVLLAFAVVTALRLYRLDDMPPHFHHDCGLFSWHAWRLLSGHYQSLLEGGYAGMPLLGHSWTAAWGWLVGTGSLAAIRAPGVAASLVAIAAAAAIAWQLAPTPLAPVITILALGTNAAFMAFSRMTQYLDPAAFQAVAVAALFFCERRALWTVVVALACAFSTLSYYSGRLTPVVCAGVGVALVAQGRLSVKRLAVAGLLSALLLAPQVWAFHQGILEWRGRIGVFCFLMEPSPHCPSTWEGTRRLLGTFWDHGDGGTQYGDGPLFMWLETGALIAACLWSFTDAGLAMMLVWGAGVLFIGAAITVDPPFYPRVIGGLIPLSVAIGIVAARLAERRIAATVVVACALTLAIGWHVGTFINYCHRPQHWLLTMGHEILALPPGAPIALFSTEPRALTCDHPFLLAFVQQRPCTTVKQLPLPPLPSGTILYVHSPAKDSPDVGTMQLERIAENEFDRLARGRIP